MSDQFHVYILQLTKDKESFLKIGYARKSIMDRINRTYLEPLGKNTRGQQKVSLTDYFDDVIPKMSVYCGDKYTAQIVENSIMRFIKEQTNSEYYKNYWCDTHFDGITETRSYNYFEFEMMCDILTDYTMNCFNGKYAYLHFKSINDINTRNYINNQY